MIENIWTQKLISEMEGWFNDGLSYADIAKAMGVSRNTVCGKIFRLGWPPRAPRMNETQRQEKKLQDAQEAVARRRLSRAKARGELVPVVIERPRIMPFVGSLEIPFAQLDDFKIGAPNQCRYIAAEPAGPDYLACGNPTPVGASYCVHHKAITSGFTLSISDHERERRALQATRNWNAAVVKAQNGPKEASA